MRAALVLALGVVGAACARDVATAPFAAVAVEADTAALVGAAVAQPIGGEPRVRVRKNGAWSGGVPVRFAVVEGGGSVARAVDTTDADGWASAGTWTAGTRVGTQRIIAFVPNGGADASVELVTSVMPGPAVTADIAPRYLPLVRGAVAQLSATLRDEYGNEVAPTATPTWTSLAPGVAGFQSADPRAVTALTAGWAPVTFAANGLVDTAYVAVPATLPAFTIDSLQTGGGFAVAVGGNGRGLQGAPSSNVVGFTLAPFAAGALVTSGTSNADIAFTPGTDTAWIADGALDRIVKVDAATGTVITAIPLPATPVRIRPSADGSHFYISTSDGVFLRLNAQTHAIASTLLSGVGQAVGVSPLGDAVFVATQLGGLARVSTATFTVTKVVQIGGLPRDLAVSADGQRVYVARGTGGVRMHLTSDLAPLATGAVLDNYAVQLAPGDSVLLVTSQAPSAVFLLDAHTLQSLGQQALSGPTRMASVPGASDVLISALGGFLIRLRF